ncbi:hypothetical protein ACJJTC_009952, partial [Scirpophaga incertulas]
IFNTQNTMENSAESCKVSMKVPSFWPEKPEIWFFQIEAQFMVQKIISEDTKFNHLISQIEPKLVEHLWDIITNSDEISKYTKCKERLLAIYKDSENKRMKTLLTGIELGDNKPSQLLRKMQALAGKDISETALKTLWLDRIYCNNLQESPDSAAFLDRLAKLEQQIAAIPALLRRSRSSSRDSRSVSRSNSRTTSRRYYNPKGKYCFFHFRFGKLCKPEKCQSPCAWI